MKKPNNKNEKTLGILSHLQKNIPPSKAPTAEQDLELSMEEEEESEEEKALDVLKPKPAKKLMY
jgi:hypothetical protein